MADQLLRLRQVERAEKPERTRHGHLRELVNRPAADGHRENLGLEPRALADRARAERHVLLDALALLRRVRVLVAALEARHDPLERERVRAAPAHAVAVLHIHALAACAVEEEVALVLRQLVPGRVGTDLVALADRADYGLVEARVADRPRH